jgi:hypothetical protein
MLSEGLGRMSDEWFTPPNLFESLKVFFDMDVAAPCEGQIFTPTQMRICVCKDGLKEEWSGLVWMNPPYSNPAPWVNKWLEHNNGLALLPMAKSKWFVDLVQTDAVFVVLPSSFKFLSPSKQKLSLMMGSTLWATGNKAKQVLEESGLGRIR